MTCAPSEYSDQPWQPPSLIRVFAFRIKKPWVLNYPSSAQRRLIRLGSESSLGAHVILLVLSCCSSNESYLIKNFEDMFSYDLAEMYVYTKPESYYLNTSRLLGTEVLASKWKSDRYLMNSEQFGQMRNWIKYSMYYIPEYNRSDVENGIEVKVSCVCRKDDLVSTTLVACKCMYLIIIYVSLCFVRWMILLH